jgi:hypothetical protein
MTRLAAAITELEKSTMHRIGALLAMKPPFVVLWLSATRNGETKVTKVNILVREVGKLNPEYSLDFDLPEVPSPGSYISIQRPNAFAEHGEDLIVEKVWWRLLHPETSGFGSTPPKIGSVKEIIVECVQATSPWSSDHWRDMLDAHRKRGKEIPAFEVARVSVRQDSMKDK